jgi:hypothetical protein
VNSVWVDGAPRAGNDIAGSRRVVRRVDSRSPSDGVLYRLAVEHAPAGLDNLVSNDRTRSVLGWEPTHVGWVEDVQTGHYIC